MSSASAGAVDDSEFAGLMGRLGPFPKSTVVAVAVSGGPDSLALVLLAERWAAARSGRLLAYTVDHGLRPEAADEARCVGDMLRQRGIEHRVLPWRRGLDDAAGQSAARDARYRLLVEACRQDGAIHLLLGHHRGDQIETLLQRLERQSGPLGLAAMQPITVRHGVRLLRPLLSLSKSRLEDTCRVAGLSPVRDPTNLDGRFDRSGLRRLLEDRDVSTLAGLAASVRRAGGIAARIDCQARRLAKGALRFRPQGYAWLDKQALVGVTPLRIHHMLSRLLQTVGGADYLRGQPVDDLADWLRSNDKESRGMTVGRVYVRRGREAAGRLRFLFCREAANLPEVTIGQEDSITWDGRFCVEMNRLSSRDGRLAPIGELGGQALKKVWNCPPGVAATLPALWRDGEIVALPQFSFHDRVEFAGNLASFDCLWLPRRSVTKNAVDWVGT